MRLFTILGMLLVGLSFGSPALAIPVKKKSEVTTTTTSPAKVTQGKSSTKAIKAAQNDGPPPPPADNEIPPPPPKLTEPKRRRSRYNRDQHRSWEERYGNGEYRKRKYKKRRRYRRRHRTYRRYRKRKEAWKRLRFWWSTETGLYMFSFDPKVAGASSLEYMGMVAGGRMGIGAGPFIMTVGAHMAFSLSDDLEGGDFGNIGGTMVRLSGTLGWAVSKYIILEAGMSMEYLKLVRGSFDTDSLLFPFHTGITLRLPIGRRAMGIRALTSFAIDPNTDGFYFSASLNLVFQTL